MATFTGNARCTFSVIARTNSRQIKIVQMKRPETRGEGRGKRTGFSLEGVIWRGEGAVHREDQTKLFFFLIKRKESCVRRGRGREGEKEMERVGDV